MNHHKRSHGCSGFTLIEIMISVLIIMIMVTGVYSYQFHAIKRVQRANAENSATRIGTLLLENWKVCGGDENYDPRDLDLDIEKVENKDLYLMTSNEIPFYFELSYEDLGSDQITGITLRELVLIVQWDSRYAREIPGSEDPILELTSYVRLDQSGG